MAFKSVEGKRAYEREWRKRQRREQPELVRAQDRTRHATRSQEELEGRRIAHNEWCANNKDRRRNTRLKSRYGITLDQYNAMLQEQCGLCAICKKPGDLAVDHCHVTGRVRGLLHRTCNTALGLLQDSPEFLDNAAAYLRSKKN